MMTKRPSTSTPASPPPPKRPSTSSRTQTWTGESPHPALPLDDATIEDFRESFKWVNKDSVTEANFDYDRVYYKLQSKYEDVQNFVLPPSFRANIELQRPHFFKMLRQAAAHSTDSDWEAVVTHSAFWTRTMTDSILESEPASELVSRDSQEKAIEKSWTAEFIGESPLRGLEAHIIDQLKLPQVYGRYCSIIQSSGMGKSRLLDEFSKGYFLIPINLRSADSQGYPPPDKPVRDYLRADKSRLMRGEANSLVRRFLFALFNKTKEILEGQTMGSCKTERITQFRLFMSKDQTMNSPGSDRISFYESVIRLAKEVELGRGQEYPSDKDLTDALQALIKALNADSDEKSVTEHRIHTPERPQLINVDVFIVFDEAHTLADSYDHDNESRFISLRRVLHALRSLPLFSFFLSTTGKITQFGQPRGQDKSNRINGGHLVSPRPFVFTGFDQLVGKFKQGQRLDHVTLLLFISHLGRPLWGSRYDHGTDDIRSSLLDFAVQKLLCTNNTANISPLTKAQTYAVLSQRLALDINTTQHLTLSEDPLQLMQALHEQVANHMRVCVAVGDGVETLHAVASSEPILSEAASYIMRTTPDFSMATALKTVLSGFCINQGDRGELLVAALFTCARDLVVQAKGTPHGDCLCHSFSVNDLFSHLFSNFEEISDKQPSICHSDVSLPFREAFSNTYMHYNHFVKPQDQSALSRGYLLLYLARGAAALGANCQPGFDAVYPFLYGDTDLVRKRVGFIIVQVKNDPNTNRSMKDVFPNMDPFGCGLLSDDDKEDGKFPIPIIRLLFLLNKKGNPTISHNKYDPPSLGTASDGVPLFTSYDFICSGVGSELFQPMRREPDSWVALVNKSQWASLYRGSVPDVVRAQLPGCGSNDGHWTPWVEGLSDIINPRSNVGK